MASNHLIETFRQHARDWADRPAQRAKVGGQWHDTTWRELGEAMEAVAGGLVALGHQAGDKVGLCARNMAEWTQADLGILAARGVTVPLYPSNTAEQARFILRDAGIRILFVGEQAEADLGLALLAAGDLEQVIALDPSVDLRGEPRARSFQALLEEGRTPACTEEVRLRAGQFRMDDLLTLVYTSGTTGEPKGVMLDHANVAEAMTLHDARLRVEAEDVSLAVLPLCGSIPVPMAAWTGWRTPNSAAPIRVSCGRRCAPSSCSA